MAIPRETALPNSALPVLVRPTKLDEVVGQQEVVSALRAMFKGKKRTPHAFLFTGPSGTGKTTLARIVAKSLLGIESVLEIDAASNSGISDMRNVVDNVRYLSVTLDGRKFVIVDECHALSKATFQSLLKPIEEPPPHVYWALCTTEPDKVPATIRSRCTAFSLKPVQWDVIADRLQEVADAQEIEVSKEILDLCARQADGNVRKALVYLDQCRGLESKQEAARLMESGVGNEEEAISLARMVCTGKGFTWANALKVVAGLDGDSAEGIRLVVVNYAAAMLKESKSPEKLLAVLEAFRGPYNTSERFAPLYLSLGTLLF